MCGCKHIRIGFSVIDNDIWFIVKRDFYFRGIRASNHYLFIQNVLYAQI